MGEPIQKGWTVATTCEPLKKVLGKYQCSHSKTMKHAVPTGKELEDTAKYTKPSRSPT